MALDFTECYPPIVYTPYWVILIGFITSTVITFATYSSGSGLFTLFKACLRCKCFRTTDLNKRHDWTEYPKIINIRAADTFKPVQDAAPLYGDYQIQHDDESDDNVPYYKSVAHIPHSEFKFYCFRYLKQNEPQFNGWAISVPDTEELLFDLIPINAMPRSYTPPDIAGSNQSNNISSTHLLDTDDPLRMLAIKRQKCIVYCIQKRALDDNFWSDHVTHSDFMDSVTAVKDHWIELNGLSKYSHNALGNEILDLNGRYLLKAIEKSTYCFGHHSNEDLSCTFRYAGMWFMSIKHTSDTTMKTLGDLVRFQFDEAAKQIVTGVAHSYQTVISEGEEVIIRISVDSWFTRTFGRVIDILFATLTFYQLVMDMLYFHDYDKRDVSSWTKYQCWCYMTMNSANTKQAAVFVVCMAVNGRSSFDYKGSGIATAALQFMMAFYYCIAFPAMMTHLLPFVFVYIWVLIPFGVLIWYIIRRSDRREWSWANGGGPAFLLFGILGYFSVILIPVGCMSRFYDGESYLNVLYSLTGERHTDDYIAHYVSNYHLAAQYLTWIW